jgi:hypothetical protein
MEEEKKTMGKGKKEIKAKNVHLRKMRRQDKYE